MASQNSLKSAINTVSVKRVRSSGEAIFSVERHSDPGFSFKNTFTDLEGLQNPNLSDINNYSAMKNTNVPLRMGFAELSNPIFDLDEQTSMMMGAEMDNVNAQMQQRTMELQNKVMANTANLARGFTRYG
jgi:hypothetical protein